MAYVFYVFISFLIIGIYSAPQEYYTTRFVHLDITAILNNRRMVNYYANCLLSRGPCPPQGLEIKRILPEALQTNCARCTEKQRTVAYQSIRRLKKEYPKIWEQLAAQWDPDGTYITKFEATFENRDFPPDNAINQSPILANRFGDDDDTDTNNIPNIASSTISPSSPSLSSSSSIASTTSKITTTTTNILINKPTNSITVIKPTLVTPLDRVGANIQATVSFGTNVVGGIVRGLEDLGARVLETGAQIADAVVSAIRPQ